MSRELYNKAYQKMTPDFFEDTQGLEKYLKANALSLTQFFQQHQAQFGYPTEHLSCLELGSGLGGFSHFLAERFQSVLGVEISDLAVSMANQIKQADNIDYLLADVTELELDQKFDFIVDSHLCHCLTDKTSRERYFHFVSQHLAKGGYFLMECMVFQERLQVPIDYSFDENYILHQAFDRGFLPVRAILPSRTIEEQVQKSGLKLNYFYYHNELAFSVFELYPQTPHEFLPRTLRLSAKLD